MTDERENLPSASAVEALELCLGRWNMMQKYPKQEAGEYANKGTRIHAYIEAKLSGNPTPELPADEVDDAEMLHGKIQEILTAGGWVIEAIEERFWMERTGGKVFSGKPDVVALTPTRSEALILDVKSLWGDHTVSEANPQLRALAVLIAAHYHVSSVTVAIVDRFGKPRECKYEPADLMKAGMMLTKLIRDIKQPDAPRTPGAKQCQYCPAKLNCHEATAVVPELALTTIHTGGEIISNVDLEALLDRCGLAEKMIGEIQAEAKRRIEADPEAFGQWTLKPGAVKQKITDIGALFSRMSERHKVSNEDFVSICTVTKKGLEDVLRKSTGLKGKGLSTEIDSILTGIAEEKQNAPSLARK